MEQRESIIDVHESSKRQKNNIYDSVDRISALPNSVLGVILSFLPTKNVVATSILSKRWKFMWLTDHSLDFYHEACSKVPGEDEDIKFLRFVSSVLHLLDVRSLNKFRLVWNPRYISSSHVSSWITIAIIRNVYELSLCVETPNGPFDIPTPFAMPITVFSCGSLQSLELNNGISVSAAIVCCFPRLESLKLVSVVFESEEAFEKLISGSPKLNYLHLHTDIAGIRKYYTEVDDDFTYRIYSTSLTCLVLCFKKYWRDRDYVDYRLKLEASSIEYLKICGSISDIFVQKSLSSLVEADFRIDINIYDISDSIGEIIQAFDRAKALILSEDVVDVLCQSRVGRSTEFKRLVKLEASTRCSEWDSLQDFIQNSDSLEAVIIHQNPDDCRGSDCVHLNWITPTEVPRCLSNSLKKVTIDRYCGFEDEYEMICYLLKHGSVLEAMNIHCDRSRIGEELQLLKSVSKIPRKSPACELHWNG